jgi:hypothetical protein
MSLIEVVDVPDLAESEFDARHEVWVEDVSAFSPAVLVQRLVQLTQNIPCCCKAVRLNPDVKIDVAGRQEPGYRCSPYVPDVRFWQALAYSSRVFRIGSGRLPSETFGREESHHIHASRPRER